MGRIIPALAGSTAGWWRRALGAPDHPRVGGEHDLEAVGLPAERGSSPRWRGALLDRGELLRRPGIIPALAGSTAFLVGRVRRGADHPRVGGEHNFAGPPSSRSVGSSPRWRGAPAGHATRKTRNRIIPALAGSTSLIEDTFDAVPDHPRVGGEHGKILHPASGSNRTDHPRVGGEHDGDARDELQAAGSSPRWRGAPRSLGPLQREAGIIPALAGSTSTRASVIRAPADHPRVGGEHDMHQDRVLLLPGSSPRWRGARLGVVEAAVGDRIIPALAGSTRTGPGR